MAGNAGIWSQIVGGRATGPYLEMAAAHYAFMVFYLL